MPTLDAIALLCQRNSAARLSAPAPTAEQIELMLQAAMRAPDHARLRPWRFLQISGEGLSALGELFAEAASVRNAALSETELAKYRQQPLRAPLLMVVVAKLSEHAKVPEQEQLLSAGCAAHALLLAAQALGYGAIWRTGDNAYDPTVAAGLGLAVQERIVGFIYLGSVNGEAKVLPQMQSRDFCQSWP